MKFSRAMHYLKKNNSCLGPDEFAYGNDILGK